MPSYEAIIARTSRQRLVTVAPHLRLLPAPEIPAEEMSDTEILEWARKRPRRPPSLSAPATEPAPRKTRQPDHARKAKICAEILAALPATIHELVQATGYGKHMLYWRLCQLAEEGAVVSSRPRGRSAQLIWAASEEACS
jgi:hypothetical protein